MLAFVISFAAWKHDCESLEPARVLRHQSCKQAGVDAATQERAKRHVGNKPKPDGLLYQIPQPLDEILFGLAVIGIEVNVPVLSDKNTVAR